MQYKENIIRYIVFDEIITKCSYEYKYTVLLYNNFENMHKLYYGSTTTYFNF